MAIPYTDAAEVEAGSRLLFMSGQVGRTLPDGDILPDFESQIRQTYVNIKSVRSSEIKEIGSGSKVEAFV